MCVSSEHATIGKALYVIRKQNGTIFQLRTDGVLYSVGKRAKGVLETLTHKDLRVRDLFEPAGQRRLDEHCTLSLPVNSDARVFRVYSAAERDVITTEVRPPRRESTLELPSFVWRDLDALEAERAIVNGKGLMVYGLPGVGKSHFCKLMVEK